MGYWKKAEEEKETKFHKETFNKETIKDILEYPIANAPERGIRKETCEKFGVRMALSETDGKTVVAYYFPYYNEKEQVVGFKKKDMTLAKTEKYHYTAIGKVSINCKLFGQQIAEHIPRKKTNLYIVEGEWDVLSAYQSLCDQVQGTKFEDLKPFVVGLSCGTANAVEALLINEDFLHKFDKIVLALDNDKATDRERKKGIIKGVDATRDIAGAFITYDLEVVDYPKEYKDASDMLQANESIALAKLLTFDRKPFKAEKVKRASDISLEEILTPREEGVYVNEFPKLMDKIHGFRKKELTLITAPSGVGKSTVCSIFCNSFIEAGKRIGMIYLEEENKETFQRMLALKLKVNYNKFKANPLSCGVTEFDIEKAYSELVENDSLIMVDHFGSMPTATLMDKIKYIHIVEKCEYIVLDHISAVLSATETTNERKEFDKVMTELAAYASSNDVGIIVISHINRSNADEFKAPKGKEDEPFWVKVTKESMRGSAALEQFAWIILGLEPQIMPDRSRGNVRLTVLKNRPWGYLGVADEFTIDEDTWQVKCVDEFSGRDF